MYLYGSEGMLASRGVFFAKIGEGPSSSPSSRNCDEIGIPLFFFSILLPSFLPSIIFLPRV